MSIEVVQFEAAHVHQLLEQGNDNDRAVRPLVDDPRGAPALISGGPSWSMIARGGYVLWCGGLIEQAQGRATAWAVIDQNPHTLSQTLATYRAAKRLLDGCGYRRVETAIRPHAGLDYHRFALMLGFRREGLARSYFADGGDAYIYARVRPQQLPNRQPHEVRLH